MTMKFSLALVLCLLIGSDTFITSGVAYQSTTPTSNSFEATDLSALTSAVERTVGTAEDVEAEKGTTSTKLLVEITSEGSTTLSTPGSGLESAKASMEASETSQIPDLKELPGIPKSFTNSRTLEIGALHAEADSSTTTEAYTPESAKIGGKVFSSESAEAASKVNLTTQLPEVDAGSGSKSTNLSSDSSMASETTSKPVETPTPTVEMKTSIAEGSNESDFTSIPVEASTKLKLTTQPLKVNTECKSTSADASSGSSAASKATSKPIEALVSTLESKTSLTEEIGKSDFTSKLAEVPAKFDSTIQEPEVDTESGLTSTDASTGSSMAPETASKPTETLPSTPEAKISEVEESSGSDFTSEAVKVPAIFDLTTFMVSEATFKPGETLAPILEVKTSTTEEVEATESLHNRSRLIKNLIIMYVKQLQAQKDADKVGEMRDTLIRLVQLCRQYFGNAGEYECTPWLK
ncbi:conserved hypothetical protein [Echinococcus multilocularis]|uniref:Uncharacterized protein n=1 Tax=Echinococcus multilocularis TaxID=6211 RepID=A0A068Y456_ECHMU|nr:conserved hypothetical protein [Echinococcus multilocularis]